MFGSNLTMLGRTYEYFGTKEGPSLVPNAWRVWWMFYCNISLLVWKHLPRFWFICRPDSRERKVFFLVLMLVMASLGNYFYSIRYLHIILFLLCSLYKRRFIWEKFMQYICKIRMRGDDIENKWSCFIRGRLRGLRGENQAWKSLSHTLAVLSNQYQCMCYFWPGCSYKDGQVCHQMGLKSHQDGHDWFGDRHNGFKDCQ